MLQKLKQAGLIWPTVAAMLALGMLLALGTWQLQRKPWKEGLIARIAARTHAAPVDLPPGPGFANPADREYLHVAVAGRLLHDKERYLYAPTPGGPRLARLHAAGDHLGPARLDQSGVGARCPQGPRDARRRARCPARCESRD